MNRTEVMPYLVQCGHSGFESCLHLVIIRVSCESYVFPLLRANTADFTESNRENILMVYMHCYGMVWFIGEHQGFRSDPTNTVLFLKSVPVLIFPYYALISPSMPYACSCHDKGQGKTQLRCCPSKTPFWYHKWSLPFLQNRDRI